MGTKASCAIPVPRLPSKAMIRAAALLAALTLGVAACGGGANHPDEAGQSKISLRKLFLGFFLCFWWERKSPSSFSAVCLSKPYCCWLFRPLAASGHLAEELLVVVLHAGDDTPLAFEDLVELTAIEPDAAALAARVDPDAAAFELDELATATRARPIDRHESEVSPP